MNKAYWITDFIAFLNTPATSRKIILNTKITNGTQMDFARNELKVKLSAKINLVNGDSL